MMVPMKGKAGRYQAWLAAGEHLGVHAWQLGWMRGWWRRRVCLGLRAAYDSVGLGLEGGDGWMLLDGV